MIPVFGPLDYVLIILYLLATVLIGVYSGRGQKDTKDFLLAGRSMPWIPLAISMYASLFSSISYLAIPAESFRYDLQYGLGSLLLPLTAYISGYLFVEFYYRLNIFTVFEYLERRFNAPMRTLMVLLFMAYRSLYAGLIVYAVSLLTSIATTSLVDVYKRWIYPHGSERHLLAMSRVFIIGWGILITWSAIEIMPRFESIIMAANTVIGLLSGIVLGIFLLGMLTRRTNTAGSLIGAVTGLAVVFYVCFRTNVSFLWYTGIGTVVSMTVGYGASRLFSPPRPEQVEELLWSQVVLKPLRKENQDVWSMFPSKTAK